MKVESAKSMKDRIRELLTGNNIGDVSPDEPMSRHTTLRIGGPADAYVRPKDMDSFRAVVISLMNEDVPLLPAGGGSNLLVSDEGVEGAVVSSSSLNHIDTIEENREAVKLFAEAGAPLGKLINLSKDKGYRGVEGLAGIPGSVGGAIKGNAGSFGFEIGDVILSVAVIRNDGRAFVIEKERLNFGYRSSNIGDDTVILGATMMLIKDDPIEMARRTADFLGEKKSKQPISMRSAGCVFKNPGGMHAGKLIDEAGCKGMKRGDVEVSSLHANFFINAGNGTAADFLELLDAVKENVVRAFGIELEPEIKMVGRSHGDR